MNLRPRLNTHRGGSDGFVTSITDSGTAFSVNWSKFYGSAQNESISAMQQLNAGEMIVGGTTPNGSWLPDADNPYSGGSDGFIAVLLGSSGTNQWSTYTGGDGAETLNTVTARNGVFYAGGMTRSESWVSGGFHTVWDKDNIFGGAEEFGFLCKYQSSGYVPDLPLFTLQPQPVTVEEQQDAQFTVEFTGTEPMICQWLTNGVPVQGETGTSLTLSAVTLAQDGDLISCVVSNLAGATTSDNALLTVTAIPNGWITIGISPSGAVSAGAAWSIDSGSTWHADGEVINVITGSYAVTYKDGLFGWAAPATPNTTTVINGQTNSLAAVYSEVFYTNYREISGTNVTVYVDPSVDADFCYLTETLPAGLTPYDYAPFSWNSSTRKLTYFMPVPAPAQFSYSVTGAEGTYQVSGTVNFGVGGVATVGDNQIVISGPPPVVPVPDIIGFAPDGGTPGNFLLTFISIADQAYLIETNGTPAALGWAQQGQVSGEADQTTTSVPASGPALFYRVRTPAP
jgi:hypothetical protein